MKIYKIGNDGWHHVAVFDHGCMIGTVKSRENGLFLTWDEIDQLHALRINSRGEK